MHPTTINILLVDQDLKTLERIKKLLEGIELSSHEILISLAQTPQEAIQMAMDILPQLIITDIDLGGKMDGIDMVLEMNQSILSPVIF